MFNEVQTIMTGSEIIGSGILGSTDVIVIDPNALFMTDENVDSPTTLDVDTTDSNAIFTE
jgi:hypothetical protein